MWLEVKHVFLIALLSNVINCAKLFNQNVNEINQNLFNNDKVANDKLKGLNRVLVKRVVPHGSESNGVEYNKELNYLYRPLVRFPAQKPINDVHLASDDGQQNENQFKVGELKDFLYNLGQNSERVKGGKNKRLKKYKEDNLNRDKVSEFLKLLEGNDKSDDGNDDRRIPTKIDNQKSDVNLILKLLHADDANDDVSEYLKYKRISRDLFDAVYGVKSKNKRELWDKIEKKMKTYRDKKDFYKNMIDTFTQLLRYGKNKNSPINKSIFTVDMEEVASQTEKPKMALPVYPYWNWWTYKKNLYHDNCRHGWVRFHNMCYELPPH